ncbi:MAG TPA: hypothetical protein VIK54_15150 [Acidimicrobiia bacterium]
MNMLRSEFMPRRFAIGVFSLLVVLAFTRSPFVFVHGRFWAEEGSFHFRRMVAHPSVRNLVFVQPNLGYYYLFLEASTWVAAKVSLLYAPLVTAWSAFSIVALMVWIALRWPSTLLPTVGARIAAAALLVVGTLAVPEVWANATNAQVYLAIAATLVLFVELDRLTRREFVAGAGLLLAAGLSGIYTCVLTPLYIASAIRTRSRRARIYALLLTIVSAVQLGVATWARSTGSLRKSRIALPHLGVMARGFATGHIATMLFGSAIGAALNRASHSFERLLLWSLLALIIVLVIGALLRDTGSKHVVMSLGCAFVLEELLVNWGAESGGGGRYAVVPIAMLTLALIHAAARARHTTARIISRGLCATILIFGLANFWTFQPATLRCIRCPRWDRQVHAYAAGVTDQLQIWPYAKKQRWSITLPKRAQTHASTSPRQVGNATRRS